MSILKIIKLESGAFLHNDSIDGDFFLGKFYFKQERNKAFIVETYGAKRREYLVTEIKVFDFGGTEESFTNFTALENRLTTLGYNGIETNGLIPANIETTANKTDSILGNETSSIKYPSVKGLVDWVNSLFVPKTRTLTIGGVTQDLSADRTFTVSGGDVYEYMNFYISGNVPYNANPDLEPFPVRGNRDVGNLSYPGDFWNRVTSTTGDYRGTAQSLFKASNLVEVIVNCSGIGQDIQIRVVAFDVNGNSVSNSRSLAVKNILGTVNTNSLKITQFLPSDINSTNVINPNTMISITATVKSGTAAATISDRFYITLKFKNI